MVECLSKVDLFVIVDILTLSDRFTRDTAKFFGGRQRCMEVALACNFLPYYPSFARLKYLGRHT